MQKLLIFIALFILFIVYSIFVYTSGTKGIIANAKAAKGKMLFQKYNCTACHQLYGLGGYLGPDLTVAFSQRGRNEAYLKAMLRTGTQRMPDFHLSENEIGELVEYLKYIDSTAITYKTKI